MLDKFNPEHRSCCARKLQLAGREGISVICKHENPAEPRVDLFEELQPLAKEVEVGNRAGDVAAWAA